MIFFYLILNIFYIVKLTKIFSVPSAPAQIKAVLSAPNKILVSWLPPKFSNGPLTGYTFYMSVVEDGQEEGTHKRALSPSTDMHEVVRAHETSTLQFWVTASTRVSSVISLFID